MSIKMFKLNYLKNKNIELFEDLGNEEFGDFKEIQNWLSISIAANVGLFWWNSSFLFIIVR